MNLPGRLRSTTLGDLLGTLHRAAATGTLELAEDRGRSHRVHVAQGLVVAVEIDGASPSLGEILRTERAAGEDVLRRSFLRAVSSRRLHGQVLVDEFCLSPEVVGSALRRQLLARLAMLEVIGDARVAFRVAVRTPANAFRDAPLEPREFLHGRRRSRERSSPRPPEVGARLGAFRVLGLTPGARTEEIKRAYRQLARSLHPDTHPGATDTERRALQEKFAEVTEAYRSLVA
jgi:DnaJ-domain-containing protein 1